MPDYNIYIKNIADSGFDPVVPDNGRDGEDGKDGQGGGGGFKISKKALSKFKPVGIATAVIVGFVAAAKMTDKVISTVEPFIAQATGDYSDLVSYNNVKKCISAVTNPFGTIMSRLNANEQFRISELRKRQERQLLGDSIINSFGEYKV